MNDFTITLTEDELYYLQEYLEEADQWRRSLSGATTQEEVVDDATLKVITAKLVEATYS